MSCKITAGRNYMLKSEYRVNIGGVTNNSYDRVRPNLGQAVTFEIRVTERQTD